VVEQEKWRIRTNEELQEMYNDLDIAAYIKKRLARVGKLVRMDHVRVGKKTFDNEVGGKENNGKTRTEMVGRR
jgi:hypothetical protein